AVPGDNPELQAARSAGVPVISRADMLAELMRMKYGVAVGGAHRQNTTTAVVAGGMGAGGPEPPAGGGRGPGGARGPPRLGRGPFLVAEADESDGSFLRLAPAVAVITNIDREHLDHYASLDEIRQAFVYFANRVPFYGVAVLCTDDPEVRTILPHVRKRTLLYGTSGPAEVRAEDIRLTHSGSRFRVVTAAGAQGEIELRLP